MPTLGASGRRRMIDRTELWNLNRRRRTRLDPCAGRERAVHGGDRAHLDDAGIDTLVELSARLDAVITDRHHELLERRIGEHDDDLAQLAEQLIGMLPGARGEV